MAYSFHKEIVINYTKVSASNHTDFPMLIKGTYSYLKSTGNGGNVTNANGYDIAFFSDINLTTQLKHEVEKWVNTTGEIVMWVKIPTLSFTADTVIFMGYGDSSITTDQSDKTNVWDANYLSVYHLGDGTTLGLNDSTSNANTLINGNSTPATPGPINGAANFTAANSNYLYGGTTISNHLTTTYSAWVNFASAATTGRDWNIMGCLNGIESNYSDRNLLFNPAQKNYLYAFCGSARYTSAPASVLPLNTWKYLSATHNEGDAMKVYVDGIEVGTTTSISCITGYTVPNLYISGRGAPGGLGVTGDYITGKVANPRFSKTIRTAGWLLTEYNNQNSPSTFYSIVDITKILGITSIQGITSITF